MKPTKGRGLQARMHTMIVLVACCGAIFWAWRHLYENADPHYESKLRHFLGCSIPEAAEILGIAPATAEDDWTYAKAWRRRRLGAEQNENSKS